jgi:Zn-dependent M28 family amino/carboxypeptidase
MTEKKKLFYLLAILAVTIVIIIVIMLPAKPTASFNGTRALQDVSYQVSLGPRTIGSAAHAQTVSWLQTELKQAGWVAEVQSAPAGEGELQNVIGKRGAGHPWIILGAHYDSRFLADQDRGGGQATPVPGANDGASGVAVLLELARILPADLDKQVWLVFLDAEDNGNLPGWDWIMGSTAFANALQDKPDAVVIIDMIGDADLNIYLEHNSDQALSAEIWALAAQLGHKQFIPELKYRMLDDHMPFIHRGMTAIDIIDFDYPYWHTTEDTLDKVSAESLHAVGDTLYHWLLK